MELRGKTCMCLILASKVIGGVQVVIAPKISQRFVVIMEADAATPRKDDTDSKQR